MNSVRIFSSKCLNHPCKEGFSHEENWKEEQAHQQCIKKVSGSFSRPSLLDVSPKSEQIQPYFHALIVCMTFWGVLFHEETLMRSKHIKRISRKSWATWAGCPYLMFHQSQNKSSLTFTSWRYSWLFKKCLSKFRDVFRTSSFQK